MKQINKSISQAENIRNIRAHSLIGMQQQNIN